LQHLQSSNTLQELQSALLKYLTYGSPVPDKKRPARKRPDGDWEYDNQTARRCMHAPLAVCAADLQDLGVGALRLANLLTAQLALAGHRVATQ
jgi:hypothetical protein